MSTKSQAQPDLLGYMALVSPRDALHVKAVDLTYTPEQFERLAKSILVGGYTIADLAKKLGLKHDKLWANIFIEKSIEKPIQMGNRLCYTSEQFKRIVAGVETKTPASLVGKRRVF